MREREREDTLAEVVPLMESRGYDAEAANRASGLLSKVALNGAL